MKRLLSFLIIAIATATAALSQYADDFTSVMAKINAETPKSVGPGLTFTAISETPEAVVLEYEINEQTMSVEALADQQDILRDVYISELTSSPDADKQALRVYIISSGKPLHYHFAGTISDDTFTIVILPGDLK